jgi:glutathione synthase/RimK-type ligase-like ATP-grasp enzyme
MMKTLMVVDDVGEWTGVLKGVSIVSSEDFLTKPDYVERSLKVFNLCRSYHYQSAGYYVSLLASARGQKVIPTISTILDLKAKHFLKLQSEGLDKLIQKSLKNLQSESFQLSVYFGKNVAQRYEKLSYELHKYFSAPLLRATFKRKDKWRLQSIGPIGLNDVPPSHFDILAHYADEYFKRRQTNKKVKIARFDLAILVNPKDEQPPSNERAIKEFLKAAEKLNIDVELITKEDFHRLPEFDGLFIRETTAVNHHTFRFSHRANALGLAVIDDPVSILRCANKVYLAELFERHKIPAPKTMLIHKNEYKTKVEKLSLPAILKEPDSSFSRGVIKVETREDLLRTLRNMFENSDMILAQEYLPTDFDWRVGVLDGKPLYVCKYFMAKNHWQIYRQVKNGCAENGQVETFSLSQAPAAVVNLAVQTCRPIGEGFYGVDIKEKNGKYYVIEVNDNPSIDYGWEDRVLKNVLYEAILKSLLNRMERIAMGVN